MRTKRRGGGKRLAALAAVISVLLALSAAAVAADLFGIRSVLLPEKTTVGVSDENGVLIPGEKEEVDAISLSGLQDTPESRALAEWQSFLDSYDPDGAIIARIGNEPTGFETRYGLYQVYTQDMADKLEEIVSRYGLKLHQQLTDVFPEQWETAAGPFLLEGGSAYTGYMYEDGTFHFDGDAELPEYGKIDYQFDRRVRGSFHDVILNITDASQYESWTCETGCGVTVSLALGPEKGLILADLGDSFVTVNVLAGTETSPADVFSSGPIGREEMEALAECFDLSVLTPVRTPDLDTPGFSEETTGSEISGEPAVPEEDPLYVRTGMETDSAKAFVWDLSQALSNGDREMVAELFVYPCKVTAPHEEFTVNTPEELLEHYDEAIDYEIRGLLDELDYHDLFASDGLAGVGNGCAWFGLVEDGEIRLFTLWNNTSGTGVRPVSGEIPAG